MIRHADEDEAALLTVIAESEGTNWTEEMIRSAFNCDGHAIISDSQVIGIAHRIALRANALEADTSILRKAVEIACSSGKFANPKAAAAKIIERIRDSSETIA